MKRLLLPAMAVLALAGCGNHVAVQSIPAIATASADDVYTSGSATGEALVKSGALDKAKFKADDAKAYAVLQSIRAGTATITDLQAAITTMLGAKK